MYRGDVWGASPPDYPTMRAQATYRKLLDAIPEPSFPRELMGYGFKGAAFRFRAMAEYQTDFERSVSSPNGAAPPDAEEFCQERWLFGFFVSGLASLESLAFGIHAVAAHYAPEHFGTDASALRRVEPKTLSEMLRSQWPNAPVTNVLTELVQQDSYRDWREIRNVLSHRMVPPRLVLISTHQPAKSMWYFTKAKLATSDEPLPGLTTGRRNWLAASIASLWSATDASFPVSP